jgi:dTDP-4-dehydrorhamnose 3,5-epimerase-like enzyme
MSDLQVKEINIPGFYVINLVAHGDNRGWFKENYQKEKLEALGLPSFNIVQNNISFNAEKGVARGLHAEPWEKYISVAKGESFGQVFTIEITPDVAVFVPRGVANGYQTLEENVSYTYLVNEHWSPEAKYTFLNLSDPDVDIAWPLPLSDQLVSEKDKNHPFLKDVIPMEV